LRGLRGFAVEGVEGGGVGQTHQVNTDLGEVSTFVEITGFSQPKDLGEV